MFIKRKCKNLTRKSIELALLHKDMALVKKKEEKKEEEEVVLEDSKVKKSKKPQVHAE